MSTEQPRVTVPGWPDVYLKDVLIEHCPPEDEWTPEHWTVWPLWAGVDRERSSGIGCSSLKNAQRLERAVRGGKAMVPIDVRTDVNGQTYVDTDHVVMAKRLNADLRRLGY